MRTATARDTVILERDVIVLSEDGSVRSEVSAVVAQRPGARTLYAGREGLADAAPARSWSIVIVDDEGRHDAVELVRRVKARNRDASVVYLAAEHSTALEEAVRRAGVSFYAVKQSRDGDLARVIEVLLSRPHG